MFGTEKSKIKGRIDVRRWGCRRVLYPSYKIQDRDPFRQKSERSLKEIMLEIRKKTYV